ncbi:uncharacterized protein [Watersipora subatra]|uniref:uncharacterized protein n=1 Tax=Watersipora subatra TaxID=2589382 RepID=UPI00355BE875
MVGYKFALTGMDFESAKISTSKRIDVWEKSKHILNEGHWWCFTCWCFTFPLTWLLSLLGYLLPDSWMSGKRNKRSLEESRPDFIPSQPSDAYEEEEFTNTGVIPVEDEEVDISEKDRVSENSLTAKESHPNAKNDLFFYFKQPADEKKHSERPDSPDSVDRFSVKRAGSTLEPREKSILKIKNHRTGKKGINWWCRGCVLFIKLFPLIVCDKEMSEQPFFFTILCNMQMGGFKTFLSASNILFAFTGLQMEILYTAQVASMNNPKRMAVSEILPVFLNSEQSLTVNRNEPVCNLFLEITNKQCPVVPSGSVEEEEHSVNNDMLQAYTMCGHYPASKYEVLIIYFRETQKTKQHTFRKSCSTLTCPPSRVAAGATCNDGIGGGRDGNDDGHKRGRYDCDVKIERTKEENNQTNHNLEYHGVCQSLNRLIDNVGAEGHNDKDREQPNQAVNPLNNLVCEPIPLIGFGDQEKGLDTDDHFYVDNEFREVGPIRDKIQTPHDDEDSDDNDSNDSNNNNDDNNGDDNDDNDDDHDDDDDDDDDDDNEENYDNEDKDAEKRRRQRRRWRQRRRQRRHRWRQRRRQRRQRLQQRQLQRRGG